MDLFHDPIDILQKAEPLLGSEWSAFLPFGAKLALYNIHKEIDSIHAGGVPVYPLGDKVLKSLRMIKPEDVKVIVLSKCDYPNNNATGFPFSCGKSYTPSLKQIHYGITGDKTVFDDMVSRYGMELDYLSEQGVLFLNRKHRIIGDDANSLNHIDEWDDFLESILTSLANINEDLIICNWGNDTQKIVEKLQKGRWKKKPNITVMNYEHPVNASKNHRFWLCDHFIKVNERLIELNEKPIRWEYPDQIMNSRED